MRRLEMGALALLSIGLAPQAGYGQSYDGYYNFLGDAPAQASPSYTQDDAQGIAVYDENLNLLGAAVLQGQSAAGWCAIDGHGKLFSGLNNQAELRRYSVDWGTLAGGGALIVTFDQTVALRDDDGSSLSLDHFQGGAFTPEGDKLYITTGYLNVDTSLHGIHAFDITRSASTFYRVRKSGQSGLFHYQFNPATLTGQEPEDLTFWDLTGGQAPEVDGELHVLLLDNDWPSNDDIYIKHYTRGIYVDGTWGGSSNGDPATPDKTVSSGVARAFDDMELRIAPGNYVESLVLSKRLRLVARPGSGSVIIGQ